MAVIHIFKDGTTASDLVDVYVPKDIVERIVTISQRNKGRSKDEKKEN